VYPLGLIYPYQTITEGIHTPDALAVDASGNLFVANLNGHNVTVYAPGGSVPIRTITDGAKDHARAQHAGGAYAKRAIADVRHAANAVVTTLVQQTLPIRRYAARRPRHGLIERMRMRRSQPRPF
jgi:hypothetical protein